MKMFDVHKVLTYSAITLGLLFLMGLYAKNFTHLLSPPPVCRADQFCGGTEPLIPPDPPAFHWDDKLTPAAAQYVHDHPGTGY